MDFDDYSKISVDAKNVTSLDIEDIDTSSLKEQEKQRYAQDTKYRKHLYTMGNAHCPIMANRDIIHYLHVRKYGLAFV